MIDKLGKCMRCSGDACYKTPFKDDGFTYFCMGCGFTTNTLMVKGSNFYNAQVEMLPSLYIDLMFEDKKGLIWYPHTINIPSVGMVFVNGTSKEDWKWTAVKPKILSKEEQINFPVKGRPGEYHSSIMDMKNPKHFERNEFMEALEYIGVFNI